MKPKYDTLWKGMMEEVIKDLLLFVEPGIGEVLNLERGFEFLDKELTEIYPEPEKPADVRVVDKLVKAYYRDGSESWMLLHMEVQGNYQKDFAKRMFEYYARLFSKYGRPIAAIAVFTGQDGKAMPGRYEDLCLWTRVNYEYKTLNIADYPDSDLEASTNPFAAVVMVAKEVLLKVREAENETDNILLEHKLKVVRLLKEKMTIYGEEKTAAILTFLNNYVSFKTPEINRKFMEQPDEIFGKKNTMGIIEQLAEIKHQEGVEEGVEKGIEQGKEESVRLFLAHTEFSPEKIAELVGVPVSLVEKVKKELSAK
jgi:hypothetical protein